MFRNLNLLVLLFFSLLQTALFAQANDECAGAILISDPTDFCSSTPVENNISATISPQPLPVCFPPGVQGDVWYTFTAVSTDLLFLLQGNTPSNSTSTLLRPAVALYSGDCGNLTEVACRFNSRNSFTMFSPDLVVGQQYFLRIASLTPGTFRFCIQNQPALDPVSADCPTATFICSKDPIIVGNVTGAGVIPNEIDNQNAPCFQGLAGETTSAWFVFTAANNGSLIFSITPSDPEDDLDFVLYRLPGGPGNCAGRVSERCMAAGDFNSQSPCMGPTGLNFTATDVNQPPGCAPGQDNWLRFINLVPGRTYALVVNNFTAEGNGFTIEWGGTAIFQGTAKAKIETNAPDKKICLGEELIVTDSSSVGSGTINFWSWNFGAGAVPATSSEQGPVTVQYQTPGPKSIILTVATDEGCAALDTVFLLVEVCCIIDADVSVVPGCPDDPAATATVDVQNGIAPINITWSNGQSGLETTTTFDSSGVYSVVVEDALGCKDSLTFPVNTPLNVGAMFPPDTSILLGQSISMTVSAQPTAGNATVFWISPSGDTLSGNPVLLSPEETTDYFVVVNNMGCVFSDSVTIRVRKPMFEVPSAFTPNGDGSNDNFGPVNIGFTFVRLEVWSRWGKKVFDSENAGRDTWNGTINGLPAPSDVYVYRINFIDPDGVMGTRSGDVTLLR